MELRLIPEEWKRKDLMINFENNYDPKESVLRDMTDDEIYYENFLAFNKMFGR